jgi:hypothetical protein
MHANFALPSQKHVLRRSKQCYFGAYREIFIVFHQSADRIHIIQLTVQ